MLVRPFRESEKPVGPHGPNREDPDWRRTLIAERDGVRLGLGTLMMVPVHDLYNVHIDVEPQARRSGVGRALFTQLQALRRHPFPIMARAMASQPLRYAFATALGFRVGVTCPSPQVDPAAAATQTWIQRHPPPAGVRLTETSTQDPERLGTAWAAMYRWMHASWAPISAGSLPRLKEMLNQATDLPNSFVAVDRDQIAALGLVARETWQGRTFLTAETVLPEIDNGDAVVASVIAAVLRRLTELGCRLLEFDNHLSDTHINVHTSVPQIGADPLTILVID